MKIFWKRRAIQILASAFLLTLPVALVNFIVDPYWCFHHEIPIGQYQKGFDERQQKTNFLAHNTFDFDTILLGNSRVSYTDPLSVPGRAFNYSTSSMRSWEFLPYLTFAASRSPSPISTVVLGLSFADASMRGASSFDPPEEYVAKARSFGFRYKNLFDLKLFRRSISYILQERRGLERDDYVRESGFITGRKMPLPVPGDFRREQTISQIETYQAGPYRRDMDYSDNRATYRELLSHFPEAKFLVFTTPVSVHLLKLLIEQGLFNFYARWLSEAVEVFGEVWNFMYVNDVTTDDYNYKDAHHYSPEVCHRIIRRLYDLPEEGAVENFGVRVTKENLADHLDFLRENLLVNLGSP